MQAPYNYLVKYYTCHDIYDKLLILFWC